MSNIKERQDQIVSEFANIDNWEDRYKKIIAMGKDLPKIPEEFYDDKYLVKGCQSKVWMHASMNDRGQVVLQADSDALIVKGLVSILLKIYSEAMPDEIIQHPPDFVQELGFKNYLSPSRANGFLSMVKQIMLYATALKMTQS